MVEDINLRSITPTTFESREIHGNPGEVSHFIDWFTFKDGLRIPRFGINKAKTTIINDIQKERIPINIASEMEADTALATPAPAQVRLTSTSSVTSSSATLHRTSKIADRLELATIEKEVLHKAAFFLLTSGRTAVAVDILDRKGEAVLCNSKKIPQVHTIVLCMKTKITSIIIVMIMMVMNNVNNYYDDNDDNQDDNDDNVNYDYHTILFVMKIMTVIGIMAKMIMIMIKVTMTIMVMIII